MIIVHSSALHYFFAPMVGALSITNIIPIVPKFPKLPIFSIFSKPPISPNASNDLNDPTLSLNLRHEPTALYNGKRKTDAAEREQRELTHYRNGAVGGLHSNVKMDKQKRYLSKNYLQNIFFLYLCS